MAGASGYGFVRDYANAQAYDDYKKMGLSGLLYNTEDPRFGQGLQTAIGQGFSGGLWVPAHNGTDPIAYAHQLNDYATKYHPSMLVPDIEFQGKGYAGSPGWDWNEAMMNEFRKLNPTQQLAVSVMGNQDDFNYKAYTGRGAQVWAQAYGGDMTPMSADAVRQRLIANGVDPSIAGVTLAPGGHAGSAGNYSAYTLDDMNPAQRQQYIQEMMAAGSRSPLSVPNGKVDAPVPIQVIPKGFKAGKTLLSDMNDAQRIAYTKQFLDAQRRPAAVAVQSVVQPKTKAQAKARAVIKRK